MKLLHFLSHFIVKCISVLLFLLFLVNVQSVTAQYSISGKITNSQTGTSLPGAHIRIENSFKGIYTDGEGNYFLQNLSAGEISLKFTHIGFESRVISFILTSDTIINLQLNEAPVMAEEIIIVSTRAAENSAMAYSTVTAEEINQQNFGQDLPYLLNNTPSVVTTSDAGTGIGYTGIRIRGSDATRINVTINNVPLNDAESQGVFWVDLPDFASSAESIQIQRGVGTSTNGAGAFGGSINIQTLKLKQNAYGTISGTAGSFNTFKQTIEFGTGSINNFTFDGRLSKIISDGYIDRATSDLKSLFLSGGYYSKRNILKFNIISGTEQTYQAWNGVHEDSLETNRTFNSAGLYYDENGHIRYYDNEVDNYHQDHYQLIWANNFSTKFNFQTVLHYTYGRGYYEQYREDDELMNYSLPDILIGADTIANTDLIRRRWLDNNFYGFTFALNYIPSNKLNFTLGSAANTYDGDHFGEVIWARYFSTGEIRHRYYDNNGSKKDFNAFGKLNYKLSNNINLFADLQYRSVNYNFLGNDNELNNIQQEAQLDFINPKAGITFDLNAKSRMYVSYSIANKEPSRDDYTESTPLSRPRPENLQDVEAGYRYSGRNFSFNLNYYYMHYTDQLVLTGAINDVGAYTRTNVSKSYRTGIELESSLKVIENLLWSANITLGKSSILQFNEFADKYTAEGFNNIIVEIHENKPIAFSPEIIGSSVLSFNIIKPLSISFINKYVGEQYLDNTANEKRKLDDYLINDLRLNFSQNIWKFKSLDAALIVNNVFDKLYSSNGYTYSYFIENELITENFYYPQAGRNYLASLTLNF